MVIGSPPFISHEVRPFVRGPSLPHVLGTYDHHSYIHMCQGLNSHYFYIIGDGHQPKSVGVYIPIIRIPSLKVGFFPSPIKRDNLDHGTHRHQASLNQGVVLSREPFAPPGPNVVALYLQVTPVPTGFDVLGV